MDSVPELQYHFYTSTQKMPIFINTLNPLNNNLSQRESTGLLPLTKCKIYVITSILRIGNISPPSNQRLLENHAPFYESTRTMIDQYRTTYPATSSITWEQLPLTLPTCEITELLTPFAPCIGVCFWKDVSRHGRKEGTTLTCHPTELKLCFWICLLVLIKMCNYGLCQLEGFRETVE